MLIEIHMIQNHAPSNLNRDDTGSPKEATFGGALRARISSQCLKRSIRTSEIFKVALAEHLGKRTRRLPVLLREAAQQLGCTEEEAAVIARKATGFGSDKETEGVETRQLVFVDTREVGPLARGLLGLLREMGPDKFAKMGQEELAGKLGTRLPRSVDIALFGRMTTSPLFEDVEASLQVAHAISTGKVDKQFDYFTAVDDLVEESGDVGAGMIGDVEFNSATFYKYLSLDWDDFVSKLGGDTETATKALRALLRTAALATPTGKQNGFAAHNPPDAILVEVKEEKIPVSYANAFVKPVRAESRSDVVEASIKALADYSVQLKAAYGIDLVSSLCLTVRGEEIQGTTAVASLDELADRLCQVVAAARETRPVL